MLHQAKYHSVCCLTNRLICCQMFLQLRRDHCKTVVPENDQGQPSIQPRPWHTFWEKNMSVARPWNDQARQSNSRSLHWQTMSTNASVHHRSIVFNPDTVFSTFDSRRCEYIPAATYHTHSWPLICQNWWVPFAYIIAPHKRKNTWMSEDHCGLKFHTLLWSTKRQKYKQTIVAYIIPKKIDQQSQGRKHDDQSWRKKFWWIADTTWITSARHFACSNKSWCAWPSTVGSQYITIPQWTLFANKPCVSPWGITKTPGPKV